MKKAYIETYGCQMNISDTELMHGILAEQGYQAAESPEDADVILVNTCAIRDHAEQRVIGRVGQLQQYRESRPEVLIGVTGCMAQRMGESLLGMAGGVDLVMGPDGYRQLPGVLDRLGAGNGAAATPAAPDSSVRGTAELNERHTSAARSDASSPSLAAQGTSAPPRPSHSLPVLGAATGAASPAPDRLAVPAGGPSVSGGTNGVGGPAAALAVLDFDPFENYEGVAPRRTSAVSAWVPVQRGCNYRCTYCIVPYVRGDEKNRDPRQILDEARALAADGVPEITLLGQSVNSYEHEDWDFPRLLRAVARVDGIRRVRFTSPHPNDFTRELVEVMATEPNVCRQLHLPVQSGDDRTLKRMLRRYTVESYLEKIGWVREAIPDISISTDIIVAFPGESDEEYEATLELMRRVRFDEAFMYKYSPREGTPAVRLPAEQFIDEEVAQRRLERLITLQRGIQAEVNEREVGSVVEVLVEKQARRGGLQGRTESNKVVVFDAAESLIGKFASVRITSSTGATFTGELADGAGSRRTGAGGAQRVA